MNKNVTNEKYFFWNSLLLYNVFMGIGVFILVGIISFILGALIAYALMAKKLNELKIENVKLFEANNSSQAVQKSSEEIIKLLQAEFKSIANQALIDNQNQLTEQNRISLEERLKPLNLTLKDYQEKIEKFNVENAKDTTSLKGEISKLIENTKEAHEVTRNLTNALTLSQNKKGAFGEGALEVILNCCGLEENIHYTKHFSSNSIDANGENKRIYPDFVVFLPENKNIVIDSKMNFKAYLDYQSAESQAEKESCLKNFKTDIKNTIKDLAKKNYQHGENLNCPDFIFMYIPIENSLALIYDDPQLVNFAYENNIILIGNVSLMTTLRLVKLLLAEEKQKESVMEIVKVGTSLFEKFSKFCTDLQSIHRKIEQVDSEFKTTIGRFQKGEDSLFRSVEKLKSMVIITTKEIPAEFLEIKE